MYSGKDLKRRNKKEPEDRCCEGSLDSRRIIEFNQCRDYTDLTRSRPPKLVGSHGQYTHLKSESADCVMMLECY